MIRPLEIRDVAAFVTLRRQALDEAPLAFASAPGDDRFASEEAVREQLHGGPASVLFGAFEPELVGVVGLYRDRHRKSAHRAHVWGMYVAPAHRRQGLAAGLLAAAIEHARGLSGVDWVQLSVSETAPAARALYERAGFQRWGTEPDALRHRGRSASEHHMALRLG